MQRETYMFSEAFFHITKNIYMLNDLCYHNTYYILIIDSKKIDWNM